MSKAWILPRAPLAFAVAIALLLHAAIAEEGAAPAVGEPTAAATPDLAF